MYTIVSGHFLFAENRERKWSWRYVEREEGKVGNGERREARKGERETEES